MVPPFANCVEDRVLGRLWVVGIDKAKGGPPAEVEFDANP